MKEFFKYVFATVVGIFIISVIGFFLMFAVIGAIIVSAEKQVVVGNNSLLVIDLDRQVVDRSINDAFSNLDIPGFTSVKTIGLNDIKKSLSNAVNDSRIKGIYLKVSVFGGGMASAEEVRNMLLDFKSKSNKPIYAYGDNFDQKAYYVATVADKIVIHPMGSVDFRGLSGEMIFYKNLLEKIGVEVQVVRGPDNKFKAAVEPFMLEKMSNENREQQLIYMTSLWKHMLKGISETRNITEEKLNELADEVLTFKHGSDMVEVGLADKTGFKDEVLDDLREITGIQARKGIPIVSIADYSKTQIDFEKFGSDKIAVIYASGDIGGVLGNNSIIGDELGLEIRKVRQDSTYKAIVLRVNSPGGAVFDSEIIWREVKLAAEEKTLVVSFGDVAASGGYYISCAADRIVAQPNTITGSIGIFGTIPNFGELLNDKLGITTDVVKTNKNSDLLATTRPMTMYENDLLRKYIAQGYDTFISHVAEGRNMTKEQVDFIGQGRVWSGENAKEIGLIDEFGGLDDAIQLAAEIAGVEEYHTVSLPVLPGSFEQFFKTGTDNIRLNIIKNEFGDKYRYYEYFKKATSYNGIFARMPYDIYVN
ncbi:MAG: signal peptide peptidase SppA [Bacteroidales bacterium]|jgi:protease-4|nr:signal peptide peptidase SppA [Bacteroidales bacterium]